MPFPCTLPASPLLNEHLALCRTYAEAQQRCSQHMAAQRAEVAQLQSEVLRLRAQALVLTTAQDWARASTGAGAVVLPLLPAALVACSMEGEADAVAEAVVLPARAPCQRLPLQSSLAEANLVVCQVGCLSQGAYWRDANDQCRRSGQTCVVVECASALQAAAALPALAVPTLYSKTTTGAAEIHAQNGLQRLPAVRWQLSK